MDLVKWIEATLAAALRPELLKVEDESTLHLGHAGAAAGGGHFRVLVVSESFVGLDKIARQRAVYAALGTAMQSTIHALALRTLTPDEWAANPIDRR